MQFKNGADVHTAEGERVGSIDRVVINPKSSQVTHLTIEKGLLFKKDKVVPISLIGPAQGDKIMLRENAGDLERLPDFEEAHYVETEKLMPAVGQPLGAGTLFWYPPVGTGWDSGGQSTRTEKELVEDTKQNIPQGAVALQEGARVISHDDQLTGSVERVITDAQEGRVTHIVVTQGMLWQAKKLVPANWIEHVSEEAVHLLVISSVFENLPEYETQD